MTQAAVTRAAVDEHPFLRRALRAGVVNHAAAARFLDVDGDEDAVAAAIRRYSEDLPGFDTDSRDARVSMQSGLGPSDDGLLFVAGCGFEPGEGDLTALLVSGRVDTRTLAAALERLHVVDIDPVAAGVAEDTLAVVVERRDGADALRVIEDALDTVPA
ncbi:hypothetical protein LPA44_06040 [Halobacterium sp. KA-4]|jgi:hypothetical protein|uniref:DUF7523 family protein n=1 Tax=Halobacterium sp. KA-4 TaxID=2896367 RepID=UPI001E52D932|nr:hypothetical protein [Halobacterium sp. KA-4]MCD2199458.1 hypothetical protein [Halobacterium sp. KA-4]